MKSKLSNVVSLRLPDSIYHLWMTWMATGHYKNMGDMIRHQMAKIHGVEPITTYAPRPGKAPKRRPYKDVDPSLTQQLQRVGNNLNQLAYEANRDKSPNDADAICARLDVIQSDIILIREAWTGLKKCT